MEDVIHDVNTVAILLSTYNGDKFLDTQLQSLCDQTYKNIHIFVRDDGSNDNTLNIINSWRDRLFITALNSESNLGPARSFMQLAYECKGYKFYAFCDQDDVWDEDKIAIAVENIKGLEFPALYFCNGRLIDKSNKLIKSIKPVESDDLNIWSEIVCGFCPGCAMMVNGELMDIVTRINYRSLPMHDLVFCLYGFIYGHVVYDCKPHYSRRMHSDNVVGREGKSKIKLARQKLRFWFVDGKSNPLSVLIEDICDNIKADSIAVSLEELVELSNYKSNIRCKMAIIRNKKFTSANIKAVRSFRIRVLLGLL